MKGAVQRKHSQLEDADEDSEEIVDVEGLWTGDFSSGAGMVPL